MHLREPGPRCLRRCHAGRPAVVHPAAADRMATLYQTHAMTMVNVKVSMLEESTSSGRWAVLSRQRARWTCGRPACRGWPQRRSSGKASRSQDIPSRRRYTCCSADKSGRSGGADGGSCGRPWWAPRWWSWSAQRKHRPGLLEAAQDGIGGAGGQGMRKVLVAGARWLVRSAARMAGRSEARARVWGG